MKFTPASIIGMGVFALLLTIWIGCDRDTRKFFEIQEGPAVRTLKVFAAQAEIEILFDPKQLDALQTRAVSGKYTAQKTLELMLGDTSLVYSIDPDTRAYAVFLPKEGMSTEHIPPGTGENVSCESIPRTHPN